VSRTLALEPPVREFCGDYIDEDDAPCPARDDVGRSTVTDRVERIRAIAADTPEADVDGLLPALLRAGVDVGPEHDRDLIVRVVAGDPVESAETNGGENFSERLTTNVVRRTTGGVVTALATSLPLRARVLLSPSAVHDI